MRKVFLVAAVAVVTLLMLPAESQAFGHRRPIRNLIAAIFHPPKPSCCGAAQYVAPTPTTRPVQSTCSGPFCPQR